MQIYQQDIIKMDLNRSGFHRSFMDHNIGKNDIAANRIGVELYRDGVSVDISSATCEGFFLSPAGEHILITGETDGNKAYVDLPQACYNYEGQFTLAIKVVGGGVTGTLRMVDGQVVNTFKDGAVAPVEEVPTYQEVIAVYEQMVATLNAAVRYDISQTLTEAEKERARQNIGASGENQFNDLGLYVSNGYVCQNLSAEE